MARKSKDTAKEFSLADFMCAELDATERKFKLTSASGIDRSKSRVSTGLLSLDLITNGGIVPGAWYTVFGGEQSCKSTLAATITAALIKNQFSGIASLFDAEGSTDPEYYSNIFSTMGVKADIGTIFGVFDDKSGTWTVKPRVRYYNPDSGEQFFDYMARLLRSLPDKVLIEGNWYLIFEDTKQNRASISKLKLEHDANYLRETGKLKVPAQDGSMQAVVLLDSYPAMLPEKQDVDDPNSAIAVQARMYSDGIKRIKGKMRRKQVTIIGVNQLRSIPMAMYGPTEQEPCGQALKFYSDVRIKMTARALPSGWSGKGMMMEEPGVDGGVDQYRFICARTHKNKLGGIPNQETWLRLWVSDADGVARGFDPVFDCYNYLKTLGIVGGQRNKMKFEGIPQLEGVKGLTWDQFKTLVIGNKEQIVELCDKLKIKPFQIRPWCRKHLASGEGLELYRKALGRKDKAADEERETVSDDDA